MIDLSFGSTEFPRAFEVRQLLYDKALKGASTRFRILDRRDSFYHCLEYEHLKHDWNGYTADQVESISPKAIVPMGFVQPERELKVFQKRPSAPLRLTPLVVDRFTDLLFGQDHKPKIMVEDDPITDDFVQAVLKKAQFWKTMTQARTHGGSMGSSLVTVALKPDKHRGRGRFVFAAHSPKTIHDVAWEDRDSFIPMGVLIQYVFFQEHEVLDTKTGDPTGQVKQTPFLYRRIIDEEMDVVFVPAPIEGTQLPVLRVDMVQSFRHGLGRFPGAFCQNIPSEDLDGVPDCDGAYQMFEIIDRQVSQQNKALLYNQDPTLVLSQDPKNQKMGLPIRKGSDNALDVGPGGSASYLEMSGGAQSASAAFVKELRQAAMDKCQVVLGDPQTMSGAAQSALAIKLLFQPMFFKAGKLREQYGPMIETLVEILLQIARKYVQPTEYEGRAKPVFDLPPKIVEKDPDPMNPDVPPARSIAERHPGKGNLVSLSWGEFSPPTPNDVQLVVQTVAAAVMANLLDVETAIQLAARAFDIEDVAALKRRVLEQIEAQKAEKTSAFGGLFPEGAPEVVEPPESPEVPPAPAPPS